MIIILISLIVVVAGYFYFFKKDAANVLQQETKSISIRDQVKEGRLKNLVFNYPEDSEINEDSFSILGLGINLGIKYHSVDLNLNEKYTKNTTPIHFYVSKNESPKDFSLEEWLDENASYKDKGSPYSPIRSYPTTVGDNNAIVLISHTAPQVNGGFYDIKTFYIFHKDDVYEIETYIQPQVERSTELTLSEKELENIKNYEKVVDEIIQSIRFVEE